MNQLEHTKVADPGIKFFQVALLLLPLTIYLGVAGQAAGIYFFGIIFPAFALTKFSSSGHRQSAKSMGWALLACWILFPASNIINVMYPGWSGRVSFAAVSDSSDLLKSQLSSTVGVTAIVLLALTYWPFSKASTVRSVSAATASSCDTINSNCLRSLQRGFTLAVAIFGLYYVFQHLTGFDYRRANHSLGTANQVGDRYRIFGFYGHPLSVAGVGLVLQSFLGTLALSSCGDSSKATSRDNNQDGSSHLLTSKPPPKYIWGILALANYFFVIMSGGRTAILVGSLLVTIGTGLWLWQRRSSKIVVVGSTTVLLGCIVLGLLSDTAGRLTGTIERVLVGGFDALGLRLTFWKVYIEAIQTSPLLGHGATHLHTGLLKKFYELQGYGALERKYNAHNIYLETVANIGLVGLLAILGLMTVLLSTLVRQARASGNPPAQTMVLGILVGVAANAIHGLTQNVFFDASVLAAYIAVFWITFWFLALPCKGSHSKPTFD